MDTLLGKYGNKAEKLEAPETAEDEKAEEKKATLMDIMGDMSVRGITPEESPEAVGPDTSMYVRKMSVLYIFSLLFEDYRKRIDELMADLRSGYEKCDTAPISEMNPESSVVMKFDMTEKHYVKETEDTGFRSKGKAVTADGRAIDFDINVLQHCNCKGNDMVTNCKRYW